VLPQNNQQQPSRRQCLQDAVLSKDGASLVVDSGGVALAVFFPELRLTQIAVAGGSLVLAGASGDLKGLGNGITNYHFTMFGKQAAMSGGLFNAIVDAGAKFTGVLAVANDLNNIRKDYNKCMSGE
jgi:hypothetical protein